MAFAMMAAKTIDKLTDRTAKRRNVKRVKASSMQINRSSGPRSSRKVVNKHLQRYILPDAARFLKG